MKSLEAFVEKDFWEYFQGFRSGCFERIVPLKKNSQDTSKSSFYSMCHSGRRIAAGVFDYINSEFMRMYCLQMAKFAFHFGSYIGILNFFLFYGRCHVAQSNFEKANDAYQHAILKNSKSPIFCCSIGLLDFQIQQYKSALEAFGNPVNLNSNWGRFGGVLAFYM